MIDCRVIEPLASRSQTVVILERLTSGIVLLIQRTGKSRRGGSEHRCVHHWRIYGAALSSS